METVHTTPADSDTRTTTVCDSMILPSRGATGGLLEWSSDEDTMVQSMVVISTMTFFVASDGAVCNGRISKVYGGIK